MIIDATGDRRRPAYHLTITREVKGRPLLVFQAKSLDSDQLVACAKHARGERADLKIMLRAPNGTITDF
jgi:hypothetical protein